MKVKQLTWIIESEVRSVTSNELYDVLIRPHQHMVRFLHYHIETFTHFEEAKKFCQEHFEKFILDQIEVQNES